MGLAWIIFADPELVLGQGRLRKLDAVPCPGNCFAVFGLLFGLLALD